MASHNFLPYEPRQLLLLPPSVADWVPEGSLARFMDDIVDELDNDGRLSAIYSSYRADGWGRAAFHPRMMLKVVLYAYCHGITSSRRIAHALEVDIALRFLSANQQPDFRTIAEFRLRHLRALEALFRDVLRLCEESGLVKMGRVALDGRKVPGNASRNNNRTRDSIEREVKRLLDEAERVDAEEDEKYGRDKRGDELPEGLRTKKDRLARLREARKRIEEKEAAIRDEREQKLEERRREEEESGKKKRGAKPFSADKVVPKDLEANTTDPDSRLMRKTDGWVQGYNGQAVVDCSSQIIVAEQLSQAENDRRQLEPMLRRCKEQARCLPDQLIADAGYWSDANAALEKRRGVELFIATVKDAEQRRKLRKLKSPRGRIPEGLSSKERMERRLLTQRGKAIYKQRGATVEPVFGQMVTRGLLRFLLRGIDRVRAEWSLWCSTHNLLKLWRSGWTSEASLA